MSSHQGTLDVQSEPGRGTTVTVILPLLVPQPEEATDDNAAANDAEIDNEVAAAIV